MKHIIYDWEDDKAARILRNSRAAMNGDGKLLVVEMVVPEGDAPSPSKFLDLEILLSLHRHERTQKEYAALFASAEFKLNRVAPRQLHATAVTKACVYRRIDVKALSGLSGPRPD